MKKPNDWETIKPYEERKELAPGGYICEIKKVEETVNRNGGDMIVVYFDIAKGENKGMFFDDYSYRKGQDNNAKWPYSGTKWINVKDTKGATHRMLKSFVNAVEAENVKIDNGRDLDFSRAKGALVGIVFREEERESMTGGTYWRTVPNYFCTCEDIRTNNYRVPKRLELQRTDAPTRVETTTDSFGFSETVDDIPF